MHERRMPFTTSKLPRQRRTKAAPQLFQSRSAPPQGHGCSPRFARIEEQHPLMQLLHQGVLVYCPRLRVRFITRSVFYRIRQTPKRREPAQNQFVPTWGSWSARAGCVRVTPAECQNTASGLLRCPARPSRCRSGSPARYPTGQVRGNRTASFRPRSKRGSARSAGTP